MDEWGISRESICVYAYIITKKPQNKKGVRGASFRRDEYLVLMGFVGFIEFLELLGQFRKQTKEQGSTDYGSEEWYPYD